LQQAVCQLGKGDRKKADLMDVSDQPKALLTNEISENSLDVYTLIIV
jgi:hypothetical protein